MLDLVFTDIDCDLVQGVCVDEMCHISPVHKLVTFDISYTKEVVQRKKIMFRHRGHFQSETLINSVMQEFTIKSCEICKHAMVCKNCATCLVKVYDGIARDEYNSLCPLIEKETVLKDHAPWFNAEILRAKREKKKKRKTVA